MIYFTFGTGSPYGRHYVQVDTDDSDTAREVMRSAHGVKWAFEYTEKEFLPQIQRFNYTRLALIKIGEHRNWRAE